MDWAALISFVFFGGRLLIGLRTGKMPLSYSSYAYEDDEPSWFWPAAAANAVLTAMFFAAYIGVMP